MGSIGESGKTGRCWRLGRGTRGEAGYESNEFLFAVHEWVLFDLYHLSIYGLVCNCIGMFNLVVVGKVISLQRIFDDMGGGDQY